MSCDIIPYNKPKTIVLGKMAEIKTKIVEAHGALQKAKEHAIAARDAYNKVPWYRPFKHNRLEKEYQNAMNDLTIANSEALIQNFKILRHIVELILLTFCIPMDGIQKIGQWIATGFEERDARFSCFVIKIIPFFEQNKRKLREKKNILEGVFRIILIISVVALIIFSISMFVLKKKSATKIESNTITESNTVDATEKVNIETIEFLQQKIIQLETSLNELKPNVEIQATESKESNSEEEVFDETDSEVDTVTENDSPLFDQMEENLDKKLESLNIENLYKE